MVSLGKRVSLVTQSDIRGMTLECERLGGINLAQGVCDTEVPVAVRRAAQCAIEEGVNTYTRFDGLAELRQAIAKKLGDFNGMAADPETEIIVSSGSTGAFYCACLALLDPGDEVILFEPFYGYHLNTLLAVQAVPAFVTLRPPDWAFAPEDVQRAITPRTRGIMINTPANPSGKVFSRVELEWIADLAKRHDLFVFTDEIYEHFVYEGRRHLSPGALPGVADRTITISGFSKTFSITGWRVGYSVSDARWAQAIGYMNDIVYVCAPAPLQMGIARGLAELDRSYYDELCRAYQAKRDKICGALERARLRPYVPEGSYYVLANVSRIPGANGKDRAMRLLATTGVAAVPGEAFFAGEGGAHLCRFCFAKPDSELDEACERLTRLA